MLSQADRGDQRLKGRYPIALDVQYKLLSGDRVDRVGSGKTLNISSGGVLFETDQQLPPRGVVELAIKWPFVLRDVCSLKLVIRGHIVRRDANTKATAVRAEHHEFRTAGIISSKGDHKETALPKVMVAASSLASDGQSRHGLYLR
ncbi:MAG TPA: PilZ domain-containing protein [Bryobacteraceae bacterium]|nr:PilZ domain-containing protein [Bryobacteraceae bacterium]